MNEQIHKKSLNYARIYTKCNQPEDSLKYIQDIAKLKKDDLTIEEINILFGSINALISKSKKQWEIICSIESNEIKKKSKFMNIARDAKESVYKEIYDYIIIGQGIIDHYLIKGVKSTDLEALYFMQKGDFFRVSLSLAQFDNEREIADLKDKAEKYYKKAYELSSLIDDLSDIKAGIVLHYCIYLFEENNNAKKAYEIANKFYETAKQLLKKIKNNNGTYLELNNIMIIMKKNIDIWKKKKDIEFSEQESERKNVKVKEEKKIDE